RWDRCCLAPVPQRFRSVPAGARQAGEDLISEGCMLLEVPHGEAIRWRRLPARAVLPVEATGNRCRPGPSSGEAGGVAGLERVARARGAAPRAACEEPGWAPTSSARFAGRDAPPGNPADDVPRGRGPDSVLRPSALLVRAVGVRLDAGPRHHPRLHA